MDDTCSLTIEGSDHMDDTCHPSVLFAQPPWFSVVASNRATISTFAATLVPIGCYVSDSELHGG